MESGQHREPHGGDMRTKDALQCESAASRGPCCSNSNRQGSCGHSCPGLAPFRGLTTSPHQPAHLNGGSLWRGTNPPPPKFSGLQDRPCPSSEHLSSMWGPACGALHVGLSTGEAQCQDQGSLPHQAATFDTPSFETQLWGVHTAAPRSGVEGVSAWCLQHCQ